MATINFLYRSRRDKAPLTLRLLFRHDDKDFVFGAITEYEIEKDYWNNEHFENKKDPNIRNKQFEVNNDLKPIENFILSKFNNTDISKINKEWLVQQLELYYNPHIEKKRNEEVTYWIDEIIKNANTRDNGKGGVGLGQCRINAYNRLKVVFNEYQGTNSYKVKELNKNIFENFKKWLINEKNYSNTYSFKKLSDLKGVCKEARSNGIETSTELTDIKTKQVSAYEDDMDVIILTLEEIEKIENAHLLKDAHINARKWLILSCYTGQRGGDLIKITSSNFKKTANKEVIELIQQKTNTKVEIPILPKVRAIYNSGLPYKISTQKLNKYLKEIGKIAKIDTPVMGRIIEESENKDERKKRGIKKLRPKYEYISTHIGRRTFCSIHDDVLPRPLVMKVSGHKKESSYLMYLNKTDDSHIDAFLEYYKKEEIKDKKKTKLRVIKNGTEK